MKAVAESVNVTRNRFGVRKLNAPTVLFELNRITESQISTFLMRCREKFIKAKIEPGDR